MSDKKKKKEEPRKRSILYGDSRSQVTNQTVQRAKEDEDTKKRQNSVNKGLAKSGNSHQTSVDAYLSDHARRQRGFTGKKEDMPFQQSQPRIQYSDMKFKMKDRPSLNSARKWKSEIGNAIDKSYGKTQNIRIKEYLKQNYGMNDGGAEDFMKYMDALETESTSKKGKEVLSTTTWTRGAREHQNNSILQNLQDTERYYENMSREIKDATPNEDEQDGDRGFLDRTFDALMIGQYVSANTAKALLDGKGGYKVSTAVKDGLRAGNPFGDGYEQGEGSYSQVLRQVESKYGNEVTEHIRDTTIGRAGIGTAGFVLDVLLDPLSYATLGVGALAKGGTKGASIVGKELSKSVSKNFGVEQIKSSADIPKISDDLYQKVLARTTAELPNASKNTIEATAKASHESIIHGLKAGFDGLDVDTAKEIVTKKNASTSFAKSTDDTLREAQELVRKYNELLGFSRQGKIGFSFGNLPFADKIVGQKLASKTFGLSDRAIRSISDKLRISKPYQQLRKSIYSSKAFAHLSTNSTAYKLAKESPDKLFDIINVAYTQRKLKGGMFDQQKVFAKIAENIEALTPSQQRDVSELLQNRAMMKPIEEKIDLVATEEAKHFRTALEQTQREEIVKFEDLKQMKAKIDELRKYQENEVFDLRTELDALDKDFLAQIEELDLELLRDTKVHAEILATIEESRKAIDDTYLNVSSDVLKGLEPLPDLPEPPKKPTMRGKPREPKLQDIPDAPVLEKAMTREEYIESIGDEVDYLVNKFDDVLKANGNDYLPTRYDFINTLNAYLKQGEDVSDLIGKTTPNYELARLVKMIEEGYNHDQIKEFINTNKYRFDGRGTEIYGILAKQIGYGDGTKYKNWDEYYTKRIEPLQSKIDKGEALTSIERRLYDELNDASFRRTELFAELKPKSMKGILRYKKQLADKELFSLENSRNAELNVLSKAELDVSQQQRLEDLRESGRAMDDPNRKTNYAYEEKPIFEEAIIYKLDTQSIDEAKVFFFNALKDLPIPKSSSQLVGIMDDVVDAIPAVIRDTFKRQWVDLTKDQRAFVVSRASKLVTSRETTNAQASINRTKKMIADKIKERMQIRHAETINSTSKIGDEIVIKGQDGVGKIVNKEYYPDGLVEYDVAYPDGIIARITTDKIETINSAKPSELLFEQLVMKDIKDGYSKHISDVQTKNNARMKLWSQEVDKVFADNKELKESYQKRLDEWVAKRDEKYAKDLEDFNKRYPQVLAERERIEAQNRATLEQIEQAQRESSKIADEYFKETETVGKLLSASKDLSEGNTLRKIAMEQLQKVHQENRAGLVKRLNDAELKLGNYAKHIGTNGVHPELMRIADEQIAKVDEEIAKLKEIKPVNMVDLLKQEAEIDVKIAELRKGINTEWYGEQQLHKRLNSALPLGKESTEKLSKEVEIQNQVKELEESKKAIWEQMSNAEKQFGDIDSWNEEMSRLILAKNQMIEDRKLVDGTLNIDDVMKELEEHIQEIDKILGNDALFEGYLRKTVAPEQINRWYKNTDYTIVHDQQLMDVSKYDAEVIKVAKMLRRELHKMGAKEVKLNKLDKEAFEKMTDGYLPHILTPNGMRLLESRKGKEELKNGGLPFGFYNAKNPHAMSRTIKELTFKDGTKAINPTIDQINRYFKEKFGTEEFFNTNLPEIFMARAMKHTELVYSAEYMENTMKLFGTSVTKQTYNPKKKYYVNVGKLRTYINEGVAEHVRDLRQRGFTGELSVDEFAKIQDGLMANMGITRSVIEDDFVPMLQLNNKTIEHLLDAGQDWVYDVPNHVVMKMNQARMVSIERDHNELLQIYDKFLHWTKLMQTVVSPSFHARNFYANLFNNWLSVGGRVNNPRFQADMYKMVKNKGNVTDMPNFKYRDVHGQWQEMSPQEMYETAKRYGAIDEGVFAQELGSTASRIKMKGNTNQKESSFRQKINPTNIQHFAGFKVGTAIGSFTDNHARLSQFIAHVQDGKSFEEAKALIDKYLFDYSDLTLFEQRVMKRIIPYYTFWRKNTSLQLKNISDQSHKMRLTAKAMNIGDGMLEEEEKVERKYVGDFAKSWIQLPMWFDGVDSFTGDEAKEPVLLNPAMPFMDLDRIPNLAEPSEAFMGIMSQTAPMIKLPLELGANKSMFFGNQITQRVQEGKGEDATYSYDPAKVAMDYGKYLLMQTAPAVQIEGMFSKKGIDKALHATSALTGIKMWASNYSTSKSIAMNKEAYEKGYMNESQKASYERYMESRSVPLDKAFEFSDNNLSLSKHHDTLKEKYFKEANGIATALDKWTNGEEYDPKYKAFIDVMSKFGEDENKARDFIGATLDKTSLDGLLLGKDFTTLDVEDVLDGDTFTVDYKGKKRSVRLLLVDTPETGKNLLAPDMAYGQEAFKFTSDMIKGKNVKMVIDNRGTDAYGRLLAYVYVDGRLLQSQLVSEGLGSVAYTDMNDSDRNNYREELLRRLQNEAKSKNKGIHSINGYVQDDGSYNNESYMTDEELRLLYGN